MAHNINMYKSEISLKNSMNKLSDLHAGPYKIFQIYSGETAANAFQLCYG